MDADKDGMVDQASKTAPSYCHDAPADLPYRPDIERPIPAVSHLDTLGLAVGAYTQAELLNGLKKAREDIENKADCTFTALMFTEDDAQVRDGAYAPQQTFHAFLSKFC